MWSRVVPNAECRSSQSSGPRSSTCQSSTLSPRSSKCSKSTQFQELYNFREIQDTQIVNANGSDKWFPADLVDGRNVLCGNSNVYWKTWTTDDDFLYIFGIQGEESFLYISADEEKGKLKLRTGSDPSQPEGISQGDKRILRTETFIAGSYTFKVEGGGYFVFYHENGTSSPLVLDKPATDNIPTNWQMI
ncbi:unnamed protein product [Clavelina lepadiformis]|uniref:Uncharacterized protein n=1 Tax=Clavelina lepadiformis TaxID=159417 RepID=A0ABP0F2J3_CLALP